MKHNDQQCTILGAVSFGTNGGRPQRYASRSVTLNACHKHSPLEASHQDARVLCHIFATDARLQGFETPAEGMKSHSALDQPHPY